MADRPEDVVEDVEDEYEDDEYEEVFAEDGAGAGGVEAVDDDGDGSSAAAGAAGGEDEDEDEDGEGTEGGGAYDDEDEDEDDDDEGAPLASSEEAEARHDPEAALAAALARQGGDRDLLRALRRTAGGLRPARLLATAGEGVSRVQRLACRLEGAGAFSVRLARRLAVRVARPALVALVAHRALRTIADSQRPCVRVARLPASRQQGYIFERAMGRNWREIMRQDMLEAIAEVDEGLNTEEVNEEKRAYQAVVLRRLEVEEWDKERMRHYYYGLYGLGPWYWDMEERLHNPFFIGSRGWNMPVEAWVGRNKIFRRDVLRSQRTGDAVGDALRAIGEERGKPVAEHVARRVKARETLTPGDALLTDPAILHVLGADAPTRQAGGVARARASEAVVALKAREELAALKERRRREREAEEARLAV